MITLPTRRVDVWNPGPVDDGEDEPVMAVAASNRRAHISSPGGSIQPGTTATAAAISAVLLVEDTPELSDESVIYDQATGEWYGVDWCRRVADFGGLGHIVAGLTGRKGVQS